MKLRNMTMRDAVKMLEWKNYPETRKFAIASHDEIRFEDHYNWLANNLEFFWIILTDEDEVAGAVRAFYGEVSVWVDRSFRGKSLATEAVKKVSRKGFTAKIVEGNIASMRCFIRSGYEPVSYADGYYTFKKT